MRAFHHLLVALFALVISVSLGLAAGPERKKQLEAWKLNLDQAEATLGRDGLRDEDLARLRTELLPIGNAVRGLVEEIEPELRAIQERLDELVKSSEGSEENDAATLPQLKKDREDTEAKRGAIDAELRQAKALDKQAFQAIAAVNDRRRNLFTQAILERSRSIIQPGLWRDFIDALPVEFRSLRFLVQDVVGTALENATLTNLSATFASLILSGWLGFWLLSVLDRRLRITPDPATSRYLKARTALRTFLRRLIPVPLAVLIVLGVLDIFGIVPQQFHEFGSGDFVAPQRLKELSSGILLMVLVIWLARASGQAALAPDESWRRLIPIDDELAHHLHRWLVTAGTVLGIGALINALHKSMVAPLSLTLITSSAVSLGIGAVLVRALLLTRPDATEAEIAADGSAGPASDARAQWLRIAGWLLLLLMIGALLSGYIGFAAFIAGRAVVTVVIGLLLYLVLTYIDGFFSEAMTPESPRGRALAKTVGLPPRTVGLLGALTSGILRLLVVLVAAALVAGPWGLLAADTLSVIQSAFFGFKVGNLTISMSAILSGIALFIGAMATTRAIQKWIEARILPQTNLDAGLQNSVATILGYIGFLIALAVAFAHIGIDLQNIALVAGALSVGIGFGLQSIVSNFVSGLILLAERPIRVGDTIVVRGEEGHVRRISVRATEIETFERATVLVPNSELITGMVKNWTHSNTTGRIVIPVRVGFDVDPDLVRDLLMDCACRQKLIVQSPAPRVLLIKFADQGMDFELRCFVSNVDHAASVKSELQLAVLYAFRKAGVIINPPVQANTIVIRDDEAGSTRS